MAKFLAVLLFFIFTFSATASGAEEKSKVHIAPDGTHIIVKSPPVAEPRTVVLEVGTEYRISEVCTEGANLWKRVTTCTWAGTVQITKDGAKDVIVSGAETQEVWRIEKVLAAISLLLMCCAILAFRLSYFSFTSAAAVAAAAAVPVVAAAAAVPAAAVPVVVAAAAAAETKNRKIFFIMSSIHLLLMVFILFFT